MVDSMMLSLYWMGIDQPAKGTILPASPRQGKARHCCKPYLTVRRCVPLTAMRHVEVIQDCLLQARIVGEAASQEQRARRRSMLLKAKPGGAAKELGQ